MEDAQQPAADIKVIGSVEGVGTRSTE